MVKLNPYLMFSGKCEEAFNFYQSVFGGEFLDFQRFKDAPPESQPPGGNPEWVMHVALDLGDGFILMGSDDNTTEEKPGPGEMIQLSIETAGEAETERIFQGLSAGGQVTMPLEKAFWGERFGMLIDRFGIYWMVSQSSGENN